ncbi:MAG: membrane protein insertase YidC [Candidatus Omnitrophica bacterium]|nr:membrane protein insertase YidC [Candidatus Omnitrophota bacterium]
MRKDNNFLLAMVITMLIVFTYPVIMKQFFPQYFSVQKQAEVAEEIILPETQVVNKSEFIREAAIVMPSSKKTYILESRRLRVLVSGPEAEIRKIEISDFPEPESDAPTVIMDADNTFNGVFCDGGLSQGATLQHVAEKEQEINFYYKKGDLQISKQIKLREEQHAIDLVVSIKNDSAETALLRYDITGATGLIKTADMESRYSNAVLISNDKSFIKGIGSLREKKIVEGVVGISGVRLRYFSLILAPVSGISEEGYCFGQLISKNNNSTVEVGINTGELIIPANSSAEQKYVLYAGPNDVNEMTALGVGIERARGKGIFLAFSDLLLFLLRLIYKIFKNYGLAVIGLSLFINVFLSPLTFKSLKSIKEMQELQPIIEDIRAKYKDDPQRLNKEIMELYKKHKVNPAGGCLPMLFQMPVFFSLYGVLMQAHELRGASFLWMKNLAAPDSFLTLSAKIPFIGSSINLLPILMIVLTFVQQAITNPGQLV